MGDHNLQGQQAHTGTSTSKTFTLCDCPALFPTLFPIFPSLRLQKYTRALRLADGRVVNPKHRKC